MTGRRMLKLLFASALALIATAAVAPVTQATSHDIRIRAIFRGADNDDAGYVMLQMTSAGQNLTLGKSIDIYGPTGNVIDNSFVLPNMAFGDNQRTILMGDTSTAGSPDVTEATLDDLLDGLSAGAICYETFDCVSYGGAGFTGEAMLPSPSGTPISGALSTTQAHVRNIAPNCATLLENADDTNSSAADFGLVTAFTPRNNSIAPIETPCPPAPSPSPGLGNPTSNINPAGHVRKRKCKKKRSSASAAKKKKCKKR